MSRGIVYLEVKADINLTINRGESILQTSIALRCRGSFQLNSSTTLAARQGSFSIEVKTQCQAKENEYIFGLIGYFVYWNGH